VVFACVRAEQGEQAFRTRPAGSLPQGLSVLLRFNGVQRATRYPPVQPRHRRAEDAFPSGSIEGIAVDTLPPVDQPPAQSMASQVQRTLVDASSGAKAGDSSRSFLLCRPVRPTRNFQGDFMTAIQPYPCQSCSQFRQRSCVAEIMIGPTGSKPLAGFVQASRSSMLRTGRDACGDSRFRSATFRQAASAASGSLLQAEEDRPSRHQQEVFTDDSYLSGYARLAGLLCRNLRALPLLRSSLRAPVCRASPE
jgi:hypothetical protein